MCSRYRYRRRQRRLVRQAACPAFRADDEMMKSLSIVPTVVERSSHRWLYRETEEEKRRKIHDARRSLRSVYHQRVPSRKRENERMTYGDMVLEHRRVESNSRQLANRPPTSPVNFRKLSDRFGKTRCSRKEERRPDTHIIGMIIAGAPASEGRKHPQTEKAGTALS